MVRNLLMPMAMVLGLGILICLITMCCLLQVADNDIKKLNDSFIEFNSLIKSQPVVRTKTEITGSVELPVKPKSK